MSTTAEMHYKTTIGLEIHVELSTASKMFCGCEVSFGGEPNTRTCPICLGLPGSLPVVNERALEYTLRIAAALNCTIAEDSVFHRKNYFYPDMPKNYQISQYDLPFGYAGYLEIDGDAGPKRIGITRVHLEEDTGKSQHVGGSGRIADALYSLEDFNRAGTPLVEIVTEPDIDSAGEARTFVNDLRVLLETLDVSDVRMEQGSLRVDANISVAPSADAGSGAKVEVKNLNSVRSVGRALTFEAERQRAALEAGDTLVQETRHFDERRGTTSTLRDKEYAFDYRYLPEPDLVPFAPAPELVERIRAAIPELPAQRRTRFRSAYGLGPKETVALTSSRSAADWFEAAARAYEGDARKIANWILGDLLGLVNEAGIELQDVRFPPQHLAELVALVDGGKISGKQAKEVLQEMFATGDSAADVAARRGLEQVSDAGALEAAVEAAIAAHPEAADKVRAGQLNTIGFLVGRVVRSTGGSANPKVVNELLRRKLAP